MKNILILNICNRHDFYGHDVEVIEETWAKDIIDNVYPNISYYSCCGMTPEMVYQTEHKSLGIIDEECHSIFLPINECQVNTYDFFLMLMKTINPKIYNTDYIMFVTPDVYVNVPLLNDFIQNIINPNDLRLFCGNIYSARYSIGPYKYCYYGGINSLLIKTSLYYDVLTKAKYRNLAQKIDTVKSPECYKYYKTNIAENAIGYILDSYLAMEAKNSWKYWQDWNMKYFGELEEEDWFRYITILVRKHGKPCGINFAQLRYIHEVIVNSYNNNDNRPDHNIISEYLIRKKTTVISVYEPDECGEDEILTTYDGDDYQKMIEDGTVDDKYDTNCNKDTTGKKPIEIVKVTGKLTIWASPTHTAVDGGWVMTAPSYGSSGNSSSCPHKPDSKPDSSLIPPVNPDDDPIGDGDDREHYVDLDNLVSTDPNNWAYDGNSNNIPDALEWHMLH